MNNLNRKNLKTLISRLYACEHEQDDATPNNLYAFNMNHAAFDCGSPACIAGHAASLMGEPSGSAGPDTLERYLEITPRMALRLFNGTFTGTPLHKITKERAIQALEKLLDGEEI